MKKQISFIFLWIFLIVSFSMLAIFVLYEANGYRLNRNNWHLELTGLIALDGQPKQADISLNGELVSNNLPFKLQKVFPGAYLISVTHDNYFTWKKIVKITGGQAYENKKVYLYYAKPEIKETTRTIKASDIKNDAKNQGSDLTISNNEIWYKEKLLTRFNEKMSGVILTDDRAHIIFQVNKEIRVMDLDGSNNTKLFDLLNSDPHDFALYSDKILFVEGEKIKEAKIR